MKKRIERFNRLSRGQKFEQILAGALRYGPYAMFVLLPAFAALLKALYLGRRRRHPGRPRLYGEHLVFAAHNHAFLFVIGILLLAVPDDVRAPGNRVLGVRLPGVVDARRLRWIVDRNRRARFRAARRLRACCSAW